MNEKMQRNGMVNDDLLDTSNPASRLFCVRLFVAERCRMSSFFVDCLLVVTLHQSIRDVYKRRSLAHTHYRTQ